MTPRIGDTVHYVPHFGEVHCRAAIVTQRSDSGREIVVRVLDPASINDHMAYPLPEPEGPTTVQNANGETCIQYGNWTPGTWHHIH